jgi:predicted nucleotidyltransferase
VSAAGAVLPGRGIADLADFHPAVRKYLRAVAEALSGSELVSLVVFGSAARGGFSETASDVDLIVVLADGAAAGEHGRVQARVAELEVAHGLAEERRRVGRLEAFAGRAGGNTLSCFVCTRSDLLSGSVARVLGLRPHEAALVDRIVFASIIGSGRTVWGEDLLPDVPVPPIRRVDVFKALFGFVNLVALIAASYTILPHATRHAMGALKRSLHSCYFCYHLRTDALDREAGFFIERLGESGTLRQLLALRAEYRDSPAFVLRCAPEIIRLHLATARDNQFPRR